MLDEVRQSIESNRIELFLQPIMTLPQRRVRYYEALTRLRNEAGDLLMPKDYLSLAESAGIMSVIDNVMLYRSVQVLRRLEKRSSARGVFCNISVHSLLDPEFFPEFVLFMEQNQTLSESMYFEFSQSMIEHCSPVEQESLAALAALGFRFSMDHVTNLDLDFQAMQDRGFRFIKIDADVLLHGMSEAKSQIHAADMRSYLERFDIQLIISKIEDERELANVLDYHVKLGQGFLFSEPRPVRPEIFGDSDAEAAA
jgi:cyclic-di-GMP phosphodiesterase TipF (flagellum assembly factor)